MQASHIPDSRRQNMKVNAKACKHPVRLRYATAVFCHLYMVHDTCIVHLARNEFKVAKEQVGTYTLTKNTSTSAEQTTMHCSV